VTVFPTCRVEYHDPAIGIDLVERCDADGIGCAITDAGCCGAPSLIAGDIDRFGRVAARNVATLSAEVRRGTDIVVSEASCRGIVRTAYVDHVGGPDAELVALHTFEPSEYFATRAHD
jgi:Fe-S oxidoreductase